MIPVKAQSRSVKYEKKYEEKKDISYYAGRALDFKHLDKTQKNGYITMLIGAVGFFTMLTIKKKILADNEDQIEELDEEE